MPEGVEESIHDEDRRWLRRRIDRCVAQSEERAPGAGRLVRLVVERTIERDRKRGRDWVMRFEGGAVAHVCDWIVSAVLNSSPWLSRVDAEGRPLKIMKLGSVAAAVAEADKSMLAFAGSVRRNALPEGHEEVHADLGGGFSLVRLVTPEALDGESAEVQHCIGQGSYDAQLGDPSVRFLSLRDGKGRAHATLHVRDGALLQFSGKQNLPPVRAYRDLVRAWLPGNVTSIVNSGRGVVMDSSGAFHDTDDLPDDLEVDGSLDLRWTGRAPRRLRVGGNLLLPEFANPPAEVEVGGELVLVAFRSAEGLPARCVAAHVNLGVLSLDALPPGLRVTGSLETGSRLARALGSSGPRFAPGHFVAMPSGGLVDLFDLPEGAEYPRDLLLSFTSASRLPRGFRVGGRLHVYTDGPDGLSLPDGMQVAGEMFAGTPGVRNGTLAPGGALTSTFVHKYPDEVRRLSLGDGISVGGHLTLQGFNSVVGGRSLSVGGKLNLWACRLDRLPQGLSVGMGLCADEAEIGGWRTGVLRADEPRLAA